MKLASIVLATIAAISSVNAKPFFSSSPSQGTTTISPLVNQLNLYKSGFSVSSTSFIQPLNVPTEIPINRTTIVFVPQTSSAISSVRFSVGSQLVNTDNSSPYSIAGDNNGVLNNWIPPQNQQFNVTATVSYNNGAAPLILNLRACSGTACTSRPTGMRIGNNGMFIRPRWP